MSPRILIVEDDRFFAGILTDYLGYLGFDVQHAADGQLGVVAFRDHPADVVLTDILLPRLNGIELSTRIRATPEGRDVPVLLMSAVYKSDETIRRDIETSGARGHLVKPFAMSALRELLEQTLPGLELPDPERSQEISIDQQVVLNRRRRGSLAEREGHIEPGSLVQLLLRLRAERRTGVLQLRDRSRWKDVVLESGVPVWADGGDSADRLGTMLLAEDTIRPDQFQAAVDAMKERGVDFGGALCDLAILTPSELYEQLRRLVHRRIVLAFAWSGGAWSFHNEVPKQTSSFAVNPMRLLWTGLGLHGDADQRQRDLAPWHDRYVIRTEAFASDWDQLKAVEPLGALGSFISGRKTMRELEEMEIIDPPDFTRALWLLYETGHVGFSLRSADSLSVTLTETGDSLPVGNNGGDEALEQRIIADYLRLWQADFYELFAADPDSSQLDLKRRIEDNPLPYTPDDLPVTLPREIRAKAKALCARLDEARAVLGDPVLRTEYDERLLGGLTGVYAPVARPEVDAASMHFDMGKANIRSRDFREATRCFHLAVQNDPNSGEYLVYEGWARYRDANGASQATARAIALLQRGLDLQPYLAMGWYFLGIIHRTRRQYADAIRLLKRALKLDPNFEGAWRALTETYELAGASPAERG